MVVLFVIYLLALGKVTLQTIIYVLFSSLGGVVCMYVIPLNQKSICSWDGSINIGV